HNYEDSRVEMIKTSWIKKGGKQFPLFRGADAVQEPGSPAIVTTSIESQALPGASPRSGQIVRSSAEFPQKPSPRSTTRRLMASQQRPQTVGSMGVANTSLFIPSPSRYAAGMFFPESKSAPTTPKNSQPRSCDFSKPWHSRSGVVMSKRELASEFAAAMIKSSKGAHRQAVSPEKSHHGMPSLTSSSANRSAPPRVKHARSSCDSPSSSWAESQRTQTGGGMRAQVQGASRSRPPPALAARSPCCSSGAGGSSSPQSRAAHRVRQESASSSGQLSHLNNFWRIVSQPRGDINTVQDEEDLDSTDLIGSLNIPPNYLNKKLLLDL
ncbi:hypothetical protein CYMTET_25559, partial [Cymbomonas tetramitiformis]